MATFDFFRRLSQSPTKPGKASVKRTFDVADLYRGPLGEQAPDAAVSENALDEKLRQAYFWIVNHAIISPHYDIEYNEEPPQSFRLGDSQSSLVLPTSQSYSSFVLMPLLTFAVRRKCLFIGGPGRGKTASAMLMGILAGYSPREIRRAMQHGHPQMTVADLLGNPLPADLVQAQAVEDIRIAWRQWLGMRVKIVDEYNRIPTRTQSALLTVMGDNYAELMNQIFECPEAAWYLTANDDQGGGTYQVIEALRDRIDVVVQALAFNSRFLNELMIRVEENLKPEEMVPTQIVFSAAEIDDMDNAVRQLELPIPIRRRIEFFASQFEFSEYSGVQFEYKTKDTSRLAGLEWHSVTAMDNGRDRLKDLGCQTQNGLSVRSLMALMIYAKALAYFRGQPQVELEDVRQVLPFVLHSRLTPDLDAPFFEQAGHAQFRSDRVSWLRRLFDLSCAEYDRLRLDQQDVVETFSAEFEQGLDGLSAREVKTRLQRIEKAIGERAQGKKLYGHLYDDLLKLKYLHQRYTNYLKWLEAKSGS